MSKNERTPLVSPASTQNKHVNKRESSTVIIDSTAIDYAGYNNDNRAIRFNSFDDNEMYLREAAGMEHNRGYQSTSTSSHDAIHRHNSLSSARSPGYYSFSSKGESKMSPSLQFRENGINVLGGPPAKIDTKPYLSLSDLVMMNIFAFAFSFSSSTYFLIILPEESTGLFPNAPAQGLALLLALSGCTQLVTPIGGYLSDKTRTRLGRRVPWMIGGSLFMIGALVSLGLIRIGISTKKSQLLQSIQGIYVIIYILFNLSANIAYSAFTGLIPDLVPESQVGEASGVLAVCASLGALFGVLVISFAVNDSRNSYFVFAGVILVGLFISCIKVVRIQNRIHYGYRHIHHVDEQTGIIEIQDPSITMPHESYQQSPQIASLSLFESMRVCSSDFTWVWISRLLFYMSMSTQAWLMFFIRDVILPVDNSFEASAPELTAVVLMVGMISSSFVAGPCGSLSDRIGRKILVYVACGLMALVDLWWSLSHNMWEVIIGAVFYGLATGCFLSVDLALAIETINKEIAAQALGIWGVAAFFGTTLGPALSGPLLEFWGSGQEDELFDPVYENGTNLDYFPTPHPTSQNVQYDRLGYAAVLALSGTCTVLSGLAITLVKNVTQTNRTRQKEKIQFII